MAKKIKKKRPARRKQVIHTSQEDVVEQLKRMDSRDIVRVHHLLGVLGLELAPAEVDEAAEAKRKEKEQKKRDEQSAERFDMMADEVRQLREELEAQKAKDQENQTPPAQ